LLLCVPFSLVVGGPAATGRARFDQKSIGGAAGAASYFKGTLVELGTDVGNLDEVVTDIAVEADEVPLRSGAVAGGPGEARWLPLGIFRARAHENPIEAALIQRCDVSHAITSPWIIARTAVRH
jgi:hypothetical protein